MSRAPVAPSGWPSAMAPPLTLTLAEVGAGLLLPGQHDRGEGLVDLDQVDVVERHARSSGSAYAVAGIGAVSIKTGRRRARSGGGCGPAASGRGPSPPARDAISSAAERVGDLARHRGGEPAALDQRAAATGSSPEFGSRGPFVERDARRAARSRARSGPRRCARQRALVALDRERLHVLARDVPLLGDHLGAAELRDLLRRRSAPRQPCELGERVGEAELLGRRSSPTRSGSWLMFCTPPATTRSLVPLITAWAAKCTACCAEPHWRSIGRAGHVLGQAGGEPAGAGDVAGLRADGVDAAEDHVLDRGAGRCRCARPARVIDVRAEVGGVDLRQAAAAPPDRACGPRRRCRPRP